MATLEVTRLYAMYVIGEVESHWNWNSITTTSDAITIGMMQWYGLRAARLIERCAEADPAGYAVFKAAAPRLAEAVEADHDWEWWTHFFMLQSEKEAWKTWAENDAVHVAQQQQWYDDFDSYLDTLEASGFSLDRPKQLIYAMSMYHQGPQLCLDVIATCSGNATLANIHATCLNSPLGDYSGRYNTVFSRLYNWDGVSAPPDFGQIDDSMIPTQPTSGAFVTNPNSPVSRVEMRNGELLIWGLEGFPQGLLCVKAAPLIWIPGSGTVGYSTNDNEQWNQGDMTGSEAQLAVVALYKSWENLFNYSMNTQGRLTPFDSGYSDCSASIWYAYKQVTGINVGEATSIMCDRGELIAEGHYSDNLPVSIMQPADLVLVNWASNYYNPKFDHVELYTGNNELWGHGGPYWPDIGPNLTTTDAVHYPQYADVQYWQVRRYL